MFNKYLTRKLAAKACVFVLNSPNSLNCTRTCIPLVRTSLLVPPCPFMCEKHIHCFFLVVRISNLGNFFFDKLGNNKFSFSFHLSPNLFGLAACCISLHTSRYANGFLRLSRLINCCLNGHSELRLRPCVQLFPSSRHSRTNHGRTED